MFDLLNNDTLNCYSISFVRGVLSRCDLEIIRMARSEKLGSGDTVAQLKEDIDTGLTGDKTITPDPGMASLGTCDEAAGTAPTPERIALARKQERRIGRIATSNDKPESHIPVIAIVGVTIVVIVVVVAFFLTR